MYSSFCLLRLRVIFHAFTFIPTWITSNWLYIKSSASLIWISYLFCVLHFCLTGVRRVLWFLHKTREHCRGWRIRMRRKLTWASNHCSFGLQKTRKFKPAQWMTVIARQSLSELLGISIWIQILPSPNSSPFANPSMIATPFLDPISVSILKEGKMTCLTNGEDS